MVAALFVRHSTDYLFEAQGRIIHKTVYSLVCSGCFEIYWLYVSNHVCTELYWTTELSIIGTEPASLCICAQYTPLCLSIVRGVFVKLLQGKVSVIKASLAHETTTMRRSTDRAFTLYTRWPLPNPAGSSGPILIGTHVMTAAQNQWTNHTTGVTVWDPSCLCGLDGNLVRSAYYLLCIECWVYTSAIPSGYNTYIERLFCASHAL